MTESSTYDSIGNMLMKEGEDYTYTRNNPVKYVDRDGEKTELVIRFANPINGFFDDKTDFGHVMININGIYYGWVPNRKLTGNTGIMNKKSETDQMLMQDYQNTEFMFFELNIDEKQEESLQSELNDIVINPGKIGNYEITNQNCLTEALKIIDATTGAKQFGGATSLTTPEIVLGNLWGKYIAKNKIIKNAEGACTKSSKLTKVPDLPQQTSSFFGIIKQESTPNDLRAKIIDTRKKSTISTKK